MRLASDGPILVVEDDQAIRESLEELLISEGFTVVVAENGLVALQVLDTGVIPSVILLDLSMPVMDGRTFLLEFAKKFPQLADVPVLIATAAGPQAIPPGVDRSRVLRKPVDLEVLLDALKEAAKQR